MSDGETALSNATVLVEAGRYRQAAALLSSYLTSVPDDAHAHALLAQASLGLNELSAARSESERALELEPDYDHALRLLALSCARLGDRAAAVQAAEAALRLAPQLWLSHHVRVSIDVSGAHYSTQGREAITTLLQLAPDSADSLAISAAHNLIGGSLHSTERQAAREYLDRALAIDPQHSYAQYLLGNLEMRSFGRASRSLHPTLDALEGNPTQSANRRIAIASFSTSVRWLAWVYCVALAIDLLAVVEPELLGYSQTTVLIAVASLVCTALFALLIARNLGRRVLSLMSVIPKVSAIFTVRLAVMAISLGVLLAGPLIPEEPMGWLALFLAPLLFVTGSLTLLDHYRGNRTWGEQWREWIR